MIQVAGLLSGDDLRGFSGGASLESDDPTALLQSTSRFFKFLPGKQQQAVLRELQDTEKAS